MLEKGEDVKMEEKSFYLTLLSNAITPEGFNENRTSAFIVDLPKEVVLEGNWKVGLSEIHYQNTINNVVKRHNRISFASTLVGFYVPVGRPGEGLYKPDDKPPEFDPDHHMVEVTREKWNSDPDDESIAKTFKHTVFFDIPEGTYHSVGQILKALNDIVSKKYKIDNFLVIDEITGKVTVNQRNGVYDELYNAFRTEEFSWHWNFKISYRPPAPVTCTLQGRLATMLGFEPDTCIIANEAVDLPKIALGIPPEMMVYCSVVEPQMIGDVYGQVLRVLSTLHPDTEYGEVMTHRFAAKNYVKVLSKNFKRISIELRSTSGELLRFKFGTTYILLSFVKQ